MSDSLSTWLQRLEARHPVTIDLGLERCGAVWQRLGAPRPARQVFTVAGTNGKGSCVTYLEALALAEGCSTGAYTSPHLLRFNERLRINGQELDDADWVRAFETVESALEDTSLTYFEFTTLAALHLMAVADLDIAMLEVGLGGRLDTVNLVDADSVVMMPIGLDHQAWLGDDRETIGREKAGVLRAGQSLVCAEPMPPRSVTTQAEQLGLNPLLAGRDFHLDGQGNGLDFRWRGHALTLPRPALVGAHQQDNLAAALTAWLEHQPTTIEFPERLAEGIRRARIPGRLMTVDCDVPLWIDVGHNPMAASVVAAQVAVAGPQPLVCVLGMLCDKDVAGVVAALDGVVSHWICAGLGGERGQDAGALVHRVQAAQPGGTVDQKANVPAAVDGALGWARARKSAGAGVLVFGSFETAGQAWQRMIESPDCSPGR